MDPLLASKYRSTVSLSGFWILNWFWFCPNEAIVGNTAIIRISFSLVSFIDFHKENIGLPYSQEKL
jgi:hypothetical protein